MAERPRVAVGGRLAWRLAKLVAGCWLVTLLAFVPVLVVALRAAGPLAMDLPDHALPEGEGALLLLEVLRPVAWPLAVSAVGGLLALAAWSVLWHAGTARWWLGAGAARVRLAEIIGHGVVWWWRFLRLTLVAVLAAGLPVACLWYLVLRRLSTAEGGFAVSHAGAVLVGVAAISTAVVGICWLATVRGAWALAESGRRSAVVAWLRGLGGTFRQPWSSVAPVLVWGLPAVAALAAPLLLGPVLALPLLVVGLLISTFCRVALYLSFAPQEPPEEWVRTMQERAASRVARPAENADQYKTGRIPTQPPLDR